MKLNQEAFLKTMNNNKKLNKKRGLSSLSKDNPLLSYYRASRPSLSSRNF